jgi:hypothetical protein
MITAILLLLALPVLAGTCTTKFTKFKTVLNFVEQSIPNSLLYENKSKPIILINKTTDSDSKEKTIWLDNLPQELKEIIIGLALGDLYIRRRYVDTCLCFKQSAKNKEYILHLYSLFKKYCSMVPRSYEQKLNGKIYECIVFDTLTYTVFNYYHELFYNNRVKIVPLKNY